MSTQFREVILQLNRAQNTATASAQLQDNFLNMAENEGRLPLDASVTVIDAFLQNLSNLMTKSSTSGFDVGGRSIKVLNLFL
jgi:hypothetical protein